MAIFYCVGFGFGRVTSQETLAECIFSVTIALVYAVIILVCKKKGMFEKVKGTAETGVPAETEVNAEEDSLL